MRADTQPRVWASTLPALPESRDARDRAIRATIAADEVAFAASGPVPSVTHGRGYRGGAMSWWVWLAISAGTAGMAFVGGMFMALYLIDTNSHVTENVRIRRFERPSLR